MSSFCGYIGKTDSETIDNIVEKLEKNCQEAPICFDDGYFHFGFVPFEKKEEEKGGCSHQQKSLLGNDFARPCADTADLDDVFVAESGQLGGGLFGAVSAAAVDENQLILVRQLRNLRV